MHGLFSDVSKDWTGATALCAVPSNPQSSAIYCTLPDLRVSSSEIFLSPPFRTPPGLTRWFRNLHHISPMYGQRGCDPANSAHRQHPQTHEIEYSEFQGFWKNERTSVSAADPNLVLHSSKEALDETVALRRKSQAPSNPSRSQMSSKTASHLPWDLGTSMIFYESSDEIVHGHPSTMFQSLTTYVQP